MIDLVNSAISKGAKLYSSISGGKDGQAMVKSLTNWGFTVEALVHADLGRIEWTESMMMCKKLQGEFDIPLYIGHRSDDRDLLDHWEDRLGKLAGTGKPFWSSAVNRYCTSDLKRGPINSFLRKCGHDFIISCEGVRAEESRARAKKNPLEIRWSITSAFYKGMTVEESIANFTSGKRLAITWYPIFNFSTEEVWSTYNMNSQLLSEAREYYRLNNSVPGWWPFHPAYAYGNDRVSCVFCILGSLNDLKVGARHRPGLLSDLIDMEIRGEATFKNNWSLQNLLQ